MLSVCPRGYKKAAVVGNARGTELEAGQIRSVIFSNIDNMKQEP